jgi:hypothetical protein
MPSSSFYVKIKSLLSLRMAVYIWYYSEESTRLNC